MALPAIRNDILSEKYVDQKFKLLYRQEFSRQSNGVTRGKDFGSPLWTAGWTTAPMTSDDAVDYEAILNSLDGVINRFYAGDIRRQFPRARPGGDFEDEGLIHSVPNTKTLRLKNLEPGLILSRGDYLSFDYGSGPSRALHQLMETVVVAGTGISPVFEVRPYIRPGAIADIEVTLHKPTALFTLEPNSIETAIASRYAMAVNFSAVQYI